MQTLSSRQLDEKIESNDNALLVNVLPRESFMEEHIPGSMNIPLETEDFTAQVEKHAGSKDQDIIVYCSSKECTASDEAAKKLENAGFNSVYHYEGGMQEWKDSGHEVRGEAQKGHADTTESKGKSMDKGKSGCCS